MTVRTANNSGTFKLTTPSDREVRMTRLFDAPRHLVFEAMTKPEHVRRWWGALDEGYAVTVCNIDLRPGVSSRARKASASDSRAAAAPLSTVRSPRRRSWSRVTGSGRPSRWTKRWTG